MKLKLIALAAMLPCLASAQTATPTVTCTPIALWGQDGEVYERSNVRLGNGFKTASECPAYVTDELRKRALAKGPGVYKDGLLCKQVTYAESTCTVTAAPKPAPTPAPIPAPAITPAPAPAPATIGLGRLPANPRVNLGSSEVRTYLTSERPGGQPNNLPSSIPWDIGSFRTVCDVSHFAFDDPIVYPGQPGRSHLHVFFGNTGTNANSTESSIANTGNSTCRGGILNRSAYWAPAMIDMTTGLPVVPGGGSTFYYKGGFGGVPKAQIRPMPAGLRMIAGDPNNKGEVWGSPIEFTCHNATQPRRQTIITNCAVGDLLEMKIKFPQCWNGTDLDSPDHKSHMAHSTGSGCPSGFPVAIPQIEFVILYPITKANEAANWRLSSDTYSGPAGYSAHGDWFNGWRPDAVNAFVTGCLNPGWDAHSHLLCDGRAIN